MEAVLPESMNAQPSPQPAPRSQQTLICEVPPAPMQSPRVSNTLDHSVIADPGTWVRLNVGGQVFQTTKQTLCREATSFLARICQDDGTLPSHKDETGAYLIDRDGQYFSTVLNYLRHGKLVMNHGIAEEGVMEEAEFYNLPHLSQLCLDRIAERNAAALKSTKHVYRVLQCHEDELTSVVSAMSDGWKFEQLVPIGAFTYSADVPSEYLCVVSRECPETADGTSESQDRAKLLQAKARHN